MDTSFTIGGGTVHRDRFGLFVRQFFAGHCFQYRLLIGPVRRNHDSDLAFVDAVDGEPVIVGHRGNVMVERRIDGLIRNFRVGSIEPTAPAECP